MLPEAMNGDPTDAELLDFLEQKEREKDVLRKQTSRKFSIVLAVFVITLSAIIYFFPSKIQNQGPAPAKKAVVEAPKPLPTPLKALYNPDPENKDPALAKDLKPFTPQDGAMNQTEDIRFAMQLMNFMDAPTMKTTLPIKDQEPEKKP